jgi:hypothetical protein
LFSSVAIVYEPKIFLIGSFDVPTYSQLIIIVLDCVLLYHVDDYETAASVRRVELISSRKEYVSIGLYTLSLIIQTSDKNVQCWNGTVIKKSITIRKYQGMKCNNSFL